MGKALKKEKLEELRDFNRQIQEESRYWKQGADELEKELSKRQDYFSSMREKLDRSRV